MKTGLFKVVGFVVLAIVVITGVILALYGMTGVVKMIIGLALLAGSLAFVLSGFCRIPEEQRWVIEVFGAFSRTTGPGLCWVFPIIERVRARISIWPRKLQLWKTPPKIDFVNGAGTPKDVFAYIRGNLPMNLPRKRKRGLVIATLIPAPGSVPDPCPDPLPDPENAVRKMAYVEGLDDLVVKLLENCARSYLNSLTVDQAMPQGGGGYEITTKIREKSPGELNGVKKQLFDWGVYLERVTVGDFDLDQSIIKAREEPMVAEKAALAAGSEMQRAATKSMGILLEAIGQLHGLVFADDGLPEHKSRIGAVDVEQVRAWLKKPNNKAAREWVLAQTQDLLKRNFALDKGALLDIRVPADAGLGGIGAAIAMILNRGLSRSSAGSPSVSDPQTSPQKDFGDMTFDEMREFARAKRKKKGKKDE